MGEIDYYQPLLHQLKWKVAAAQISHQRRAGVSRSVFLTGPNQQQMVVRVLRAKRLRARISEQLDRLGQQCDPALVPFVWAALGDGEVGFLTELRPPCHPYPPKAGLGYCMLQLLGMVSTLRDAGIAIQQLSPHWLIWDPEALPRLVDYRWIVQDSAAAAGYWTHPTLMRSPVSPPNPFAPAAPPPDTAVWSCIQIALARFPAAGAATDQETALRDAFRALLETPCNMSHVLGVVMGELELPVSEFPDWGAAELHSPKTAPAQIGGGEPAFAGSPPNLELPRWNYSPNSASKSPASKRRLTSLRYREASAPSTKRWS